MFWVKREKDNQLGSILENYLRRKQYAYVLFPSKANVTYYTLDLFLLLEKTYIVDLISTITLE